MGGACAFFLLIAALSTLLMHELQTQRARTARCSSSPRRRVPPGPRERHATRLITDAMPALISYIGPDATYRFANNLYENWFGRATEKIVGRHMRDVLGADAYDLIQPRLERALRANACSSRGIFPIKAACAKSPRTTFRTSSDGTVRGCFALVEDVSARKRAERALREADRRKDEFLAILAHELRNPLTPIRNVAHILAQGQPDPSHRATLG